MPAMLTTGAVASRLGVPVWCVRRLYERHVLPEPSRAGQYRLVSAEDLPAIEQALDKAGYLRHRETAACAGA